MQSEGRGGGGHKGELITQSATTDGTPTENMMTMMTTMTIITKMTMMIMMTTMTMMSSAVHMHFYFFPKILENLENLVPKILPFTCIFISSLKTLPPLFFLPFNFLVSSYNQI